MQIFTIEVKTAFKWQISKNTYFQSNGKAGDPDF